MGGQVHTRATHPVLSAVLALAIVAAVVSGCRGGAGAAATPTTRHTVRGDAKPLATTAPHRAASHAAKRSPGSGSGGSKGSDQPADTTTPSPPNVPSDVPMPNPRLTPGAIQSSDTAAICTPGWSSAHRDVSYATENAVAAEYGLSSHDGYEIDHLIPLELGGSNAVANLWPEPYGSPYGAIEKDGLEDWLHQQVCDGSLSLATAQREIASNWYAAWVAGGKPLPSWFGYSNSPPGGGGSSSSGTTPTATTQPAGTGAWCRATAAPSDDGYPGDYEVDVHSNRPDTKATASDANDSWSHDTNSSGYVDIRLYHTSRGESITVSVGGATCSTTA